MAKKGSFIRAYPCPKVLKYLHFLKVVSTTSSFNDKMDHVYGTSFQSVVTVVVNVFDKARLDRI